MRSRGKKPRIHHPPNQIITPRPSFRTAPGTILLNFALHLRDVFVDALVLVFAKKRFVASLFATLVVAAVIYSIDGIHQPFIAYIESSAIYYSWWIGLGILSSVGLGTGLHTFMLFLAPFIAQTTLAAYSCHSLAFDTRGPNSFVCPTDQFSSQSITIWKVYSKVRWEVFFWGFGTAIGELPPYFVARAAALAGRNDPEFASIERILAKDPSKRNISDRANIMMHNIVIKLGFFGILLCASVPNPLFDLAGIICGHFSVPFRTFFGATMIGKSLIKSSIQSYFVIVVFSEQAQQTVLALLREHAPFLHTHTESLFKDLTSRFQGRPNENLPTSTVTIIWNSLMTLMILYFLVSIIESLALLRINRKKQKP